MYQVPLNVMQALVNYLGTRPHADVDAGVIYGALKKIVVEHDKPKETKAEVPAAVIDTVKTKKKRGVNAQPN